MSIADRIPAIAAAELSQARMLLGQEAETAREAVSRAARATDAAAVDAALAMLAGVVEAIGALKAKL